MPRKAPQVPVNPILIGDLPRAEKEALSTFVRLPGNTYQNASIGKCQMQDEGTNCDCHFEPGRSEPYIACGEGSDCINRLTLVECIEGDCPSRSHCQNQRFQRKQYADVGVVLTEKKGFGLRALSNIPNDAFIYEYVGEVVKEAEFLRRMRKYADEGIRHFYFMMLQKDEFIDATKKGDIGRFANHSCNPNCYVSKWFVGNRVRMGIFAKRPILKDEELTFNYNVDRYGHDAQECYCGEPNCVGFIGGKTQTDIGGMDDLYIDALGITDAVEKLNLKGSKKKKSRKLDEDYVPVLSPIVEEEVPLVCQAIRQASSSNQRMLPHLLNRLKLSQDQDVLRGVMRLRGFSLMNTLLADHEGDPAIIKLILEAMLPWPLMNRNKVEDSNIEEPVRKYAASEDTEMQDLANRLLSLWSSLETGYRIPRRLMKVEDVDGQPIRVIPATERPIKRLRNEDEDEKWVAPAFKLNAVTSIKPPSMSETTPPFEPAAFTLTQRPTGPTKDELNAIIMRATEAAAAASAAAAREAAEAEEEAVRAAAAQAKRAAAKQRQKEKSEAKKHKAMTADSHKKLLKLVGEVVVKYMSRHRNEMDHETFKKHAKELTHIITEKEKKSSSYQAGKLDSLSDEKRQKMKKFIHDYIKKVLKRLKDKQANGSSDISFKPHKPNGVENGAQGSTATPTGQEMDDMVQDILGDDDADADADRDADDDGGAVDDGRSRSGTPMAISPSASPS